MDRKFGGGGWRGSLIILSLAVTTACVREGSAQNVGTQAIIRDDTARVAWLLRVARGSDPLLCELTVRSVDMHGWWSRGGPDRSHPLEMDSAATALIAWIQTTHNDPAVVPRLRAALRDQDRCVRRVAGSFLGRVEHPSAAEALIAALDDANPDTRNVAALGLGLADDDDKSVSVTTAIEPLMRRLRDDSPSVRRSAAWALGALGAKTSMMQLIDVMQRDTDPLVRQAAAWAIGRVGG